MVDSLVRGENGWEGILAGFWKDAGAKATQRLALLQARYMAQMPLVGEL